MKKLIAVSVILVLLAVGSVFAETSISGTVETRMVVLSNDDLTDKDSKSFTSLTGGQGGSTTPVADGNYGAGYIVLRGQNDDGTFGGMVRANAYGGQYGWRNFAWWKPIPQLRIFLGVEGDGMFGTDAIAGWAFHQGDKMAKHDWGQWRDVFPGNWDNYGLALSFYLVPGLDLSIATLSNTNKRFENHLAHLQYSLGYALPGIGKAMLTFKGSGKTSYDRDWKGSPAEYGQLSGSFLLTAIDGIQIQLGAAGKVYGSPSKQKDEPLLIGLGFTFGAEWGGIKARARADVGLGSGDDGNTSFKIAGDLMPWFGLGSLNLFINIGVDMSKANKDADPVTDLRFEPYIRIPVSGGGTVEAGIMVGVKNLDDVGPVTLSIPFRLVFGL